MSKIVRIAAAFALSLLAAGALQQIMMTAAHLEGPLAAVPPLAAMVAVVSAVFGIAAWRKWPVGLTAVVLLAVIAVVAVGGIAIGLANRSPGVGGDILYGLASLIDLYFLLPCALAIPIHWLLLRSG
jgi:hypothetical protein